MNDIIGFAVLVAAGVLATFCAYLLWRSVLVAEVRDRVLFDRTRSVRECIERHDSLPSARTMLWSLFTFWWTPREGPK